MTTFDLLKQAIPRLCAAGVDSPRLDAELLLAFLLRVDRQWLWIHPATEVSPDTAEQYDALLQRRAAREPLAYLVGEREFYGRPFTVTPAVLIPRPETELLVEAVLEWMRAQGASRVADIGAGSGAIAITLACEAPAATVVAVDLSADALEVARANARHLRVEQRIRWYEGDLVQPLIQQDERVDAVVANLPYIAAEEMDALMPEVRDYEPRLALEAADRGLALIRRLIDEAPAVLRPGGLLAMELGQGQADEVAALLRASGWQAVRVITDYAQIPRHVLTEIPKNRVT